MEKKDYKILESCDSPQHGVLIKDKFISLTDKEAEGLLKKKPPVIKIKTTNDGPINNKPLNKTNKAKGQGGTDNVSK